MTTLTPEAEALAKAENERDQLQRWKDEALPVIDGLQELGKALGMPLGSRITGPEAVDRLAALLAEVRADERARIAKPGDPGARMEAYYYGFDPTGVGIIDDILSAVAHAGKAFHGTENWTEFWYGRGEFLPHGGDTPVQAIQNAANAAADELRQP